jgi:transposase
MIYNSGMANRQFQLSENEITQLQQRETQTRDVREMKRLQGVRLYGTGLPITQVMAVTGNGESTIREWVQKYQTGGVAALGWQGNGQNASKLTVGQRTDLVERLHHYRPDEVLSPAVRLSQGRFWTVSDLQLVVEQWYGVVYQDAGSYRHLLHRCGFSYQRAERVYKSRPSAADLADFEAKLEKK